MSSLSSFYERNISDYTDQIRAIQKKLTLTGLFRLLSFLGLIVAVYYLFQNLSDWRLLTTLALIPGGVFILLVARHYRLKDRWALLDKLLYVNTNERAVLNNDANGFADGHGFLNGESYLDDLDIFGKASLFHVLNRTTTRHGMEALASLLKRSFLSVPDITAYQQAIRALSPQAGLRQLLTATGLLKGEKEGDLYSLAAWIESPTPLRRNKKVLFTRWVIIGYNIATLLLLLVTGEYRPLLIGILAGWIVTYLFSRYIAEQHAQLGKKHGVLEQYMSILRVFQKMETGEALLLQNLKTGTGRAGQAIRRLARLSTFFDQSLNFLVGFFLNNLFLYNLNCVIALEKWKEKHKKSFPEWVGMVGQVECLNSLAGFAFNNPGYIYPAPVAEEKWFLEAAGMAHPLIPAPERVANDFVIGRPERLILVTGSNMSGKTTFLRTAGVNLLLAQCGAPVCASAFSFTPMQILTSLRVSDSLQEHTSYFMAELKKLQKIIHNLQTGAPSLVLIDEILRGTNSEDKTYGSEQFIRKLLLYQGLSLFATHDLSLGRLEEGFPGIISNYCFESTLAGDSLHFNYQLQRGIARNRNASFLMKKMEII
jgi:ABC-type multidrug transport system fused ATPase/permease subunit